MAGAASAAIVACPASDAAAQTKVEGFALDQLEPTPAGDAFFGVPSAGVGGHLVPRAMVMFDYAHRPLRFRTDAGGETPIVASQGILRLDASFALWDRTEFSVDVPFAIVQSGQDPKIPGVDYHPPTTAAVGDLRLGLRARLVGGDRKVKTGPVMQNVDKTALVHRFAGIFKCGERTGVSTKQPQPLAEWHSPPIPIPLLQRKKRWR